MTRQGNKAEVYKAGEGKTISYPAKKKKPNTPYLHLLFAGVEQVAAAAAVKISHTHHGQDTVDEVIIKSFSLAA